jgi:hypothetical protein
MVDHPLRTKTISKHHTYMTNFLRLISAFQRPYARPLAAILLALILFPAPLSAATLHRGTHSESRSLDPHKAVGTILNTEQSVFPLYFHAGRRLVNPVVKGWVDNPGSANLTRYLTLNR